MISIVVPARNEGAVLGRTLHAMTTGAEPGELDIVVVCNGCTDDTAEVARKFGSPVRVVETDVPGKPNALNLGDRLARGFPRIYVDADVVLNVDAIRALAARLRQGDILAAAPRAHIWSERSSAAVRAFYRIQKLLPSALEGIGGSGVYALSEKGRRRFEQFPAITADDGYVRIQFKPEERATLDSVHSIVFAPRTLSDLIAIKSRSHLGNYELATLYADQWPNRGESNRGVLLRLLRSVRLWPSLAVYYFVSIEARRQARRRLRNNNLVWKRDDTSRVPGMRPLGAGKFE